jgi:hypothetical protein
MEIKLVTYETTGCHPYPVFRVIDSNHMPIETLSQEKLESSQFLCVSNDDNVFISGINFCTYMHWYVDDVKHKKCTPVEKLKEIHIIIR